MKAGQFVMRLEMRLGDGGREKRGREKRGQTPFFQTAEKSESVPVFPGMKVEYF